MKNLTKKNNRNDNDHDQDDDGKNNDHLIFGKNSILECLETNPEKVSKIWILKDNPNPKLKELEIKARKEKIPVLKLDRKSLDRISEGEDHRSAIAEISPIKVFGEEILLDPNVKTIFLPVNIEDPHNLGAVIRTAHAFAVDAVVINSRKSAPVTSTVISTSAGSAFKIKIVRSGNLVNLIRKLKENGFWIYGTSVSSENSTPLHQIKFDRKSVVLVGNEGKGLGDLLMKNCDFLVHIPMEFESLNVSVATGIVLNKVYQDAGV